MQRETVILERELPPLTKECGRCKTTLELSCFPVRKNKHLGICRPCYEQHYGDPDKVDERQKIADRRQHAARLGRAKAVIVERLRCGCMDCGETDIVVLEFDHRDPSQKGADISKLMHGGRINKLNEELDKCDVVCANCHRKRTAKMFGSWRNLLLEEN